MIYVDNLYGNAEMYTANVECGVPVLFLDERGTQCCASAD